MAISSAAASLGGSLISSAFGLFGARKQNKSARAEAAVNREFQERMSNSAYQRASQDLKKAGLNRVLAVRQGGATTPSGNMAPIVNEMTEAANSARNVATQIAQLENIRANTSKINADKNYRNRELEILNTSGKGPAADIINTTTTSAKSIGDGIDRGLRKLDPYLAKTVQKGVDTWDRSIRNFNKEGDRKYREAIRKTKNPKYKAWLIRQYNSFKRRQK